MKQFRRAIVLTCLAAALSGCGAGGAASAMIAGTVTGLVPGIAVLLANNGTQTISVRSDGNFVFSGQVRAGTAYAVTVMTNPAGATCAVKNGTGTVGQYSEDVSTILVTCTPVRGSVFGIVSGMDSGSSVVVQNQTSAYDTSLTNLFSVPANGGFAFPTLLEAGFSYDVSIAVQPPGQICVVTNGAGKVPATGGIAAILINCST